MGNKIRMSECLNELKIKIQILFIYLFIIIINGFDGSPAGDPQHNQFTQNKRPKPV